MPSEQYLIIHKDEDNSHIGHRPDLMNCIEISSQALLSNAIKTMHGIACMTDLLLNICAFVHIKEINQIPN